MKEDNLIERLGELAFLSRLRRLCERLAKDAGKIYKSQSINFEARWFPVTYLLKDRAGMAVTEVATALGMTHPSVNQIANAMAKRGVLSSSRDKDDERKRLLRLTPEGMALVKILEPIWRDIADATREVLDFTGIDVLLALSRIEEELDRKSVHERVTDRIKKRQYDSVEIIDYSPEYSEHFRTLNTGWLEEHGWMEPHDTAILSDPKGMIIDRGGYILFARLNGRIIGTCAMVKADKDVFKLTKMAVAPAARGRQAGRKLADKAIEKARSQGAASVVLETNKKLTAAIDLYQKLGFVQVRPESMRQLQYKRPSIMMKLQLNNNES